MQWPFRGCTECDIGSMSDLISMLGCCVPAVYDYSLEERFQVSTVQLQIATCVRLGSDTVYRLRGA